MRKRIARVAHASEQSSSSVRNRCRISRPRRDHPSSRIRMVWPPHAHFFRSRMWDTAANGLTLERYLAKKKTILFPPSCGGVLRGSESTIFPSPSPATSAAEGVVLGKSHRHPSGLRAPSPNPPKPRLLRSSPDQSTRKQRADPLPSPSGAAPTRRPI
jgi:hypothetical protein